MCDVRFEFNRHKNTEMDSYEGTFHCFFCCVSRHTNIGKIEEITEMIFLYEYYSRYWNNIENPFIFTSALWFINNVMSISTTSTLGAGIICELSNTLKTDKTSVWKTSHFFLKTVYLEGKSVINYRYFTGKNCRNFRNFRHLGQFSGKFSPGKIFTNIWRKLSSQKIEFI